MWWFDRNWRFSIPPPFVNTSRTGASWQGLNNAAWGSYVYYKTAEVFGSSHGINRSLALTKAFAPDWRPGYDAVGMTQHPAQHRYPVWWTGDGVPLQGSVESMVDAGVHDFKPFVHSDCGGDYRGSAGDLLRWTAHCAFGTILRFHGSDHRLWSYPDTDTVETARQYLSARYKLLPTLIAAGHKATATGAPLAARGDLYWPEVPGSSTNQQYIFLEDILVAPIWETSSNRTSRDVWVPPGKWIDAWNGSVVEGPANLSATQPYERQPMWHRQGGLLVLANAPGSRVESQDWSMLTLEVYPVLDARGVTRRNVYERGTGSRTELHMITNETAGLHLTIGAAEDGSSRSWIVRFNLPPGQHGIRAVADGAELDTTGMHIPPVDSSASFFPFGGAGTAPAQLAGPVLELVLVSSKGPRVVEVQFSSSP